MEKVRLGDVVSKQITGEWGTELKDTEQGIPVIRTANFRNDGTIDYEKIVYRSINKDKIKEKYLVKGDIIVEKSGGTDNNPVGRVVLFEGESNTFVSNNFTQVLRVAEGCYYKYIFYQLFYNYKNGSTLKMFNKTTGIQNLQMKSYLDQRIFLVPLEEQIKIANKLDKIQEIIDIRKEQIEQLEELVKARFVELFGDMAHSSNKVCLEEISDFVTVGIANSATHAYADSGVVMLRNQNIKENYLDENDLIYITPDFAKKYGSKQLTENDILVIRTGYPGVACLVPKKYEGCQTFTTLIVRLKDSTFAHANYVCHYINSSFGKDYVEQSKVGVAQQNFGAKALAKMPIAIPTMDLQEQFAAFVKQTDKSKLAYEKSLAEMENLMESLMNKYFN